MESAWHWKHLLSTMSRPGLAAASCARALLAQHVANTHNAAIIILCPNSMAVLPGGNISRSVGIAPCTAAGAVVAGASTSGHLNSLSRLRGRVGEGAAAAPQARRM